MAKPTTYPGSVVAIFLEDPNTPGTFLRPCGLTSHTHSFKKNMTEFKVPDCSDPELPTWIDRNVESFDFSASGNGHLASEAVDTWWEAFADHESINARIYIGKPDDVAKGRFWEGKVHVDQFEVSGETKNEAMVSINIVSDGELTYNTVTV